jgi:hypothetical protein
LVVLSMSSPTGGRGPNPAAASLTDPVVTSAPSTSSPLAPSTSPLASATTTITGSGAIGIVTSVNSHTPDRASGSSAGLASGASASSAISIISFDQPLPEAYRFEATSPSPTASSIRNRDGGGGLSALFGEILRNGSPSPFRGTGTRPPPTTQSQADTAQITGPQQQEHVDDHVEDHSDRFGIETKSLSPSLREHVIENGRSYHAYKAGKYPFPNDLDEQDRDDLNHQITLRLCRDRYYDAPIQDMLERGAEVLDLGTGTGLWCIESK